jgi:hypothetical protein
MLSHQNRRLLALFDELPSSAVVPLKIAAAYKGVSEKTIRRIFPLIEVSPRRVGVRKVDLLVEEKSAAA